MNKQTQHELTEAKQRQNETSPRDLVQQAIPNGDQLNLRTFIVQILMQFEGAPEQSTWQWAEAASSHSDCE